MSKIPVRNMKGEQVGEYEISDDLLEMDKGMQSVHDAVVAHLANRRAGTASTLTKGTVAGSGKKPWKQKGTGRARAGYRQSPVWRGGGVAFGPKPRVYEKKITRKQGHLAFRRAVSEKIASGELMMLEELKLEAPKTKQMAKVLSNLKLDRGALILVDQMDDQVKRAARNIERLELSAVKLANTYQVLRYPMVVVTRGGMRDLEGRLKPGRSA